MDRYDFGNRLYKLRTEKGYTQEKLGKMLGVSNKAISKWENGTTQPRLQMLDKIASCFDMSVEELLENTDEKSYDTYETESKVTKTDAQFNGQVDKTTKRKYALISIVTIIAVVAGIAVTVLAQRNIAEKNKGEKSVRSSSTSSSEQTSTGPATENKHALSYAVYFSEKRAFKEPVSTAYFYSTDYGKDKELFIGKHIKNWEIDYKSYEGFDEVRDDRLYVLSVNKDTNKGKITLFSDYEVKSYRGDTFNEGIYDITKDGVCAIINGNEIVLLDNKGKIVKSFYKSSEGEIKSFLIKEELIWFVCGDAIFRLYIPTGNVDVICEKIGADRFLNFLQPVSNHEIEWLETFRTDRSPYLCERACFYDSMYDSFLTKEYIPDSQPQEVIYPERRWWSEGDAHFKFPDIFINYNNYNSVEGSLRYCRENNICYACSPILEAYTKDRPKYFDAVQTENAEFVDKFFEDYSQDNRKVYFIESKFENIDGKTVITYRGEVFSTETNKLEPIEKVFTYDIVFTEDFYIRNLNPSETNYFNND